MQRIKVNADKTAKLPCIIFYFLYNNSHSICSIVRSLKTLEKYENTRGEISQILVSNVASFHINEKKNWHNG